MIYLIYPSDSSTSFLDKLIDNFQQSISNNEVVVISCEANDISYSEAFKEIKKIPDNSSVIFMGHGTPEILYGGASLEYPRRALVNLNDMSVFKNKKITLMSCYSSQLLQSSRRQRNYADAIGFGLLPSDLSEIEGKSELEALQLDKSDIIKYQQCLVEIFSELTKLLLKNVTIEKIIVKLRLIINSKINDSILVCNEVKLAHLLFYTVAHIYQG